MGKVTAAALKRKQAVSNELLIPVDDDQRDEYEAAKARVEGAEQLVQMANLSDDEDQVKASEAKLAAAKEHLESVKAEIRAKGTAITLVGVGRDRWEAILREHPPTPAQAEEDDKKAADDPDHIKRTFDPDGFWPAIVAATADSDLGPEDWRKLVFENPAWGPAELEELRSRTRVVNQGSRVVQLGN